MVIEAQLTQFNLTDTSGLYVGQPVSVMSGDSGLPAGTVIAGRRSTSGFVFRRNLREARPATICSWSDHIRIKYQSRHREHGGTFGGTGSILGSTVTGSIMVVFLRPAIASESFTVGNAIIEGASGHYRIGRTPLAR